MMRLGLMTALRGVPVGAIPRVIALVNNREVPEDVRIQAIRVLGVARSPQALEVLLSITDGGRSLFGRSKLPPKSAELLAALTALATGWGRETRAMAVLARAALSSDPEIRAATDPEGAAA
jgi:hypothetical protein